MWIRIERAAMNFLRYFLAIVLALAGAQTNAAVLALAPTAKGNLHVVDTSSGNSTVLETVSCCAVQTGSVAADTINHRVFFIANRSDGADLFAFAYGASPSLTSHPVSLGQRVTHLAYDAANARLVGLAVTDAGAVDVIALSPTTGTVTVIGTLGASCCTLRAGVGAYAAASGIFYAVGKRAIDTNDQLLAISVATATLANAYDIGDERVGQLVVDGSTLYALSYSQSGAVMRPGTFTFAPTFAFHPIGAGTSDCCFVLAGSAAIDHAANRLTALTRSSSASGSFVIRSFSLSSGAVTVGKALTAMGLFEDSATLFDRIFADSFE
jgi:hypothetical protein